MRTLALIGITVLFIAGCAGEAEQAEADNSTDQAAEEQSVHDQVVDEITGKRAIDQGQVMKNQIDAIKADRAAKQQDVDEAAGR